MLKGIRGSSILFSNQFDKQQSFYLKSDFVNNLYDYYRLGGYYTILSSEIITLCIYFSSFLGFLFLTHCIKYDKLLELDNTQEPETFLTILDFNSFTNMEPGFIGLSILFGCFFLFKIFTLIDQMRIFSKIRKFLHTNIKLSDSDLRHLTWEEIIYKIKEIYNEPQINVYLLSSRITIGDNILLSLFDKNIITLKYLSSLMEFNLKFCFVSALLNYERLINYESIEDPKKIKNKIKQRIRYIAVLEFLLMPLLVLCSLFFNLIYFAERFYHHPGGLFAFEWTRYCKWKWRAYNELESNFEQRLEEIRPTSNQYVNHFKNPLFQILKQFTYHVLSLTFVFFLLISFLNQNALLSLVVIGDRSVLWFLGILGSVLSLLRSYSAKNVTTKSVKKEMKFILDTMELEDEEWIKTAHKKKSCKRFLYYFNYKILNILYGGIKTIVAPFELWNLQYELDEIVYFLRNSFVKHPYLGYISKFSIFEKDDFMYCEDKKKETSLKIFKKQYEKTSIILRIN